MPQKKLIDILSQKEIDYIITLYKNNTSLRKIEELTHHSRQAIAKMLEELQIKNTYGNHYRYYFFDFDYFSIINDEKKAYWLGFLYADGSIGTSKYGEQTFKLSLQEQDKEILEKYKNDLKSSYPLRYDNSSILQNGTISKQVILEQRNQKTVDDLKKLGCVERKSLILTFPTEQQVPSQYVYDFIRGYFDGDGSISQYNNEYHVSIVGTENFINKLSTYFKGGSVFKDKRKNNSWYFSLNGNLQIINFYHLLYDNATRYLQRKYQKFQSLLKKYHEREGIKI